MQVACDGADGLHRLSQEGQLLVEMPLRSWPHSRCLLTLPALLPQKQLVFKCTLLQKREDSMHTGTLSLQYYSLNSFSVPRAHSLCQYRRV